MLKENWKCYLKFDISKFHAFLCMCGFLGCEALCWLCQERTVNTIQIMPSNKAMWNYGSRTIAPNSKTNPNSNTNPNRGQFSLGAIVWFSSNPKTNPDLDTNPSPNQGQFLRRVIVRIPKLHLPDAFTVGFKQNWKIIVFNIIANFKFYLLTVL